MLMITKDRAYRHFDFELREKAEDGKMIVVGQPVIFGVETVLWEYDGIQYKEVIDSRALDEAKMDDVVLNIDHEGKPAAKTKNGTLKLFLRHDGLYMEADLSKNTTGRELYEDIRNGFYDKMSFAFKVREDSYDRETHTRTILKIERIYDVSAVTWAAYEQTSLSARNWAKVQYEIEAAEAAKKQAEALRGAEATRVDIEKYKSLLLKKYF